MLKKKSKLLWVSLVLCLCFGLFSFPVLAQNFTGTAGSDSINGTSLNDTMLGYGGNDFLNGYAGDDTIFGDDGDDYISGGDGNDTLAGGNEDDLLMGDAGADTYFVDDATRYGMDRIVEGTAGNYDNNRIVLDYNLSDVSFVRGPFVNNDLTILFRYHGNIVVVEGFFSGYIKTIQCNDVTLSYQQVANMAR